MEEGSERGERWWGGVGGRRRGGCRNEGAGVVTCGDVGRGGGVSRRRRSVGWSVGRCVPAVVVRLRTLVSGQSHGICPPNRGAGGVEYVV